MVPTHEQVVTHRYVVHYPEHPAREDDPHYRDFEAYRKRTKADAVCALGAARGDFSECDLERPLELHHAHVEFSLQNGVDLKWLERDYPGISDPEQVGAWVESADNLEWLCVRCHRGPGGVHVASASDYEAERYVRGLIGKELCASSACDYLAGNVGGFLRVEYQSRQVDVRPVHADRAAAVVHLGPVGPRVSVICRPCEIAGYLDGDGYADLSRSWHVRCKGCNCDCKREKRRTLLRFLRKFQRAEGMAV